MLKCDIFAFTFTFHIQKCPKAKRYFNFQPTVHSRVSVDPRVNQIPVENVEKMYNIWKRLKHVIRSIREGFKWNIKEIWCIFSRIFWPRYKLNGKNILKFFLDLYLYTSKDGTLKDGNNQFLIFLLKRVYMMSYDM